MQGQSPPVQVKDPYTDRYYPHACRLIYPGSQAPFWGEEVTSPAIVGLNTILVRLCHPIEGLGGLLTKCFWRDG